MQSWFSEPGNTWPLETTSQHFMFHRKVHQEVFHHYLLEVGAGHSSSGGNNAELEVHVLFNV